MACRWPCTPWCTPRPPRKTPGSTGGRPDGEIDLWADATPYVGGFVCPASRVWQQQKTDRLLRLAQAGASFFMFDFVNYRPCWSGEHGHSVPLTRGAHSQGTLS